MLFNVALLSAFASVALAGANSEFTKWGKMTLRSNADLIKRQDGYEPTETYCSDGDTCAEACGATYQTCPSNDGFLHCFDPTQGELCCPDGTGNACDAGYYCTQDASGDTWCCPDGDSLAACAAAYSITGVLVAEPTATSTSVALVATSSVVPTTSAYVAVSSSSSSNYSKSTSSASFNLFGGGYSTSTTSTTASTTTTTTGGTVLFTGAANMDRVYMGLEVLAIGVAGVAAVL